MASDPHFLDYVMEQAGLGQALAARRMFGEYGLYLDGRFIAVVADNQLLLKPTDAARQLLPTIAEAPPYPGARPWLQLAEALDTPDLLQRLLKATAAALPPPGATSRGRAAPGKSRAQGSSPGTRHRS